MTGLLIGAAIAIAATLLLMLLPFRRAGAAATASHKQLNAAIHRDQMAELERDREAGTLAEEDYRQAREELQRRVLEDGQGEEAAPTLKAPKKTIIALAVLLPLFSLGIYLWLGHPEATDPQVQHRLSAQDIDKMVATLAAKMEKEPNNVEGWTMLARSYKAMGRMDDAERAYAHLLSVSANDAQMLADYADLLAMKAGGRFDGKPEQLIGQALKVDPDNPMALWLAGTADYNGGRFDGAIAHWTRLQRLLPPESDDARQIAGALSDARQRAGKPAAQASPAKAVRGRVELAPGLKEKVSPEDAVMIVAREAGGPRMPIAVLKLRASELPREFTLDDSLAMTPDRTLSAVAAIEVEARISKRGQATPQAGDLYSSTQKAKPGKSGLRLVIDQVRQ